LVKGFWRKKYCGLAYMTFVKDTYAVMGNPISHSLSPNIHQRFAEQTNQSLDYSALLIELDGFENGVADFRQKEGKGLNITVPFKQEAWRIAHQRDELAELAGAVNTLKFDGQKILGFNTDGIGLVRDLVNNCGLLLAAKRILLLGAGGAARGVILPILKQSPSELVIANRTVEKAIKLADKFSIYGSIQASSYESTKGDFDLIINATSAGLSREIPNIHPGLVTDRTVCYDMMYGAKPTAFVEWSKKNGCQCAFDGLGMLVEQAAESFRIWRAIKPEAAQVIAEIRHSL
jgi:shikimate dehydrogenase